MYTFKCKRVCENCQSVSFGKLPIEETEEEAHGKSGKCNDALIAFIFRKCKICKKRIGNFNDCVAQASAAHRTKYSNFETFSEEVKAIGFSPISPEYMKDFYVAKSVSKPYIEIWKDKKTGEYRKANVKIIVGFSRMEALRYASAKSSLAELDL